MSDPTSNAQPNAPDADSGDQRTPQQVADYWLDQIEFSGKRMKSFYTRGKSIIKRYRNKRTTTTFGVPVENRRMNVLWSNVQTLKPVLFSQTPKANVSRRNKSSKDPVGRTTAIVLQNVLQNSLGMEDYAYVMGQVVDDRLLPGHGICMVEYKPQLQDDEIGWQAAETVYIHWQDWLTNVARTWQEVTWWGYQTFHTRREVYDLVLNATGDEEYAQSVRREITLDHTEEKSSGDSRSDGKSKATVWCIWDKTTKRVIFVAPGYVHGPLADLEAPVNFDGFFPCPRPLQATTTNDTTEPVPDFNQYADQADEIDLMTQRIAGLSKSLRLRGWYAADKESVKQVMSDAGDNDLIPVENWMMVMEAGGMDKMISWFPVDKIAQTLAHCIEARAAAIQVMYEVTGISDIMRGATEASETAAAQQLKAQFGGIRVRDSQREVARFNRDILRLKGEVIAEHFVLDVIKAMSGVNLLTQEEKQRIQGAQQMIEQRNAQLQAQGLPPVPAPPIPPMVADAMKEPTWDEVMALLRNEKLRGFTVDVETDSTIEVDQQAQQAAAAQFLTAVTQYLGAASEILMAAPQAAPLLGEMLSWGTRQFKVADSIEGAIDEFVEQLTVAAQAPKPPTPQDQKAAADVEVAKIGAQTAQIKAGAEQGKAQASLMQTQLEHETTMQEKAADLAVAKATPQPAGAPA